MNKNIKISLLITFILFSKYLYGQKENFKEKSITFFIHTHKFFNKRIADSLSTEMNKTCLNFKSQLDTSNNSLPLIKNPPRFAYFDFENVKYFRVNPTEYILFEIQNKNDSIYNEKNFSNIWKISRDSLIISVFKINKFKTLNYRIEESYKDFSNFKVLKIDTKNIRKICGFNCYEIILESERKTLKMYVTNEIELNYHPILNDLNILKNYYPLYLKFIDKQFPKDNFIEYRFIKGE